MAKGLLLFIAVLISVSALAEKSYIVYYRENNKSDLRTQSSESQETQRLIVDVKEDDIDDFLSEINDDDRVVLVEENIIMKITWEPGEVNQANEDPYYDEQWSLKEEDYGIYMPDAWEKTKGRNIVVAVLDTGILPSINDFYRVLPGADLISRSNIANDGNGRDMDPSDPGDWSLAKEFPQCSRYAQNSTWHGSHVAGIVAAKGNNGTGIIGVAPEASILPVRVLGKCGGEMHDIADGIRWAVGGKVDGLPINNNPADIINMSLGAEGECSATIQDAIDFAKARGAVVVVSSGNGNGQRGYNLDDRPFTPASCTGIINIGSSDIWATRSHFSNYGDSVDVMAPGGTGKYGSGILSFSNNGLRGPLSNILVEKDGTSMAAPHVSGAAALILSVNPGLYPDQIEQILKDSAEPIVGTGTGAGIINVPDALKLAETTVPDPNFKSIESPYSGKAKRYTSSLNRTGDDSGGGSCGTIDLNDGGGPGGKNGFFLTLLMGLVMSRYFKKVSV